MAALLAAVLTAMGPLPQPPRTAPVQGMLEGVNSERRMERVPTLQSDACLSAVANERAQDMVQQNYFSHFTPDGLSPWDFLRAEGCNFHYAAENIAEADDEDTALAELWGSSPHRENTLNAHYAKIGIAVATRPDGTEVFVEDFSD